MANEGKLAFSFPSKTKPPSSRPNSSERPQPFDPQDPTADSSQSKPQFVTVFEQDREGRMRGLAYQPSANDSIVEGKKGYVQNKNRKPEAKAPWIVRIVSGVLIGLKGEVLRRVEGNKLVLKLVDGGEEVRLDAEMVAELGSEAEERCLRKLKEREIHDRRERKKRKLEELEGRDKEEGKKRELEDRLEELEDRVEELENRDRKERKDKRKLELAIRDRKERMEKRQVKDDKKNRGPSEDSREKSHVQWLVRHIRVRVISRDFKGGKWYMKKAEVVNVVGPTTCDILMDGSSELLQGVDQEILETAVPKCGGSVFVLHGRHKGVYGTLVERNMEEETGVVRDANNHYLNDVLFEEIAEYVGDPSDLGY